MNIKELKEKRDSLHDNLHKLLAEYKPKENEIREQIKEIQEELYKREMTPVAQKLKHEIEEGLLEGEKLEAAKAKMEVIGFLLD